MSNPQELLCMRIAKEFPAYTVEMVRQLPLQEIYVFAEFFNIENTEFEKYKIELGLT